MFHTNKQLNKLMMIIIMEEQVLSLFNSYQIMNKYFDFLSQFIYISKIFTCLIIKNNLKYRKYNKNNVE